MILINTSINSLLIQFHYIVQICFIIDKIKIPQRLRLQNQLTNKIRMYRTYQNYDNKPLKWENQPYFKKKHYLCFLEDYQRLSVSSLTNKKSNNELLIIAKAYFLKKQYKQTIKILNMIPLQTNTYILYERQTLIFKANYLLFFSSGGQIQKKNDQKQAQSQKLQKLQSLKIILETYSLNRTLLPGPPLNRFHADAIAQMQKILQWYEQQDQVVENQHINGQIEGSIEKIGESRYQQKLQREKEKEQQFYKQLGKKKLFQGMPSYLISKDWLSRYEKYIKKVGDHPGPITNFSIINHISNVLHYTQPQKSYLNILVFPLTSGDDYITISSRQWGILYLKYGGIAVKRLVSRAQPSYARKSTLDAGDNLIKVLVKIKNPQQNWVIQFSNNLYWQKHTTEILQKFFHQGQLKEYRWFGNPQMEDFSTVVVQNQVHQIEHCLHFFNIEFGPKKLQPSDQKRKVKLLRKYNLEPYKVQHQRGSIEQKRVPTGLSNLSNSCYLNSSIQCLRNIDVLNQYFVDNTFLKDLNFTETNKLGSYGQVACAFADTLKGLWKVNDQRFGFSPDVFKDAFGRRYEDFNNLEQQDANQFLSFLLNCLHDDLNRNVGNKLRRHSVSHRNFEAVRDFTIDNQNTTNKSLINDLFQGYHYSEIYCQVCEDRIHRFDIFLMLTLPLPPLAQNVKIYFVDLLNINEQTEQKPKNSSYLTIYTAGFKTVKDLVHMVITRYIKDKTKKTDQYLMLCLDDKHFEIQREIEFQMEIESLIKMYRTKKFLFFLYEKPQIQIKQREVLTIVEFKYNSDRVGYPRIILTDSKVKEDEFIKKINAYLQQLGYDEVRTTRSVLSSHKQKQQRIVGCQKIKIQQIKQKNYTCTRRLKVYINKKYKLCYFNQINQAIGDSHNNMKFDLDTCFKISTQKERIDEREGWRCERCKQKTVAFKQQTLHSVGQILVICLKRFSEGQKITAKIDYPVNGLDISQYQNQGKGSKIGIQNSRSAQIFDLQSVCIHRGTLHRGHYISYCKNPYDKKWYCFDDQIVKEITQEAVVSQNAYILFYRRRHQPARINLM